MAVDPVPAVLLDHDPGTVDVVERIDEMPAECNARWRQCQPPRDAIDVPVEGLHHAENERSHALGPRREELSETRFDHGELALETRDIVCTQCRKDSARIFDDRRRERLMKCRAGSDKNRSFAERIRRQIDHSSIDLEPEMARGVFAARQDAADELRSAQDIPIGSA